MSQSITELLNRLEDRVEQTVEKFREGLSPVTKELRQFKVAFYPCLMEYFSSRDESRNDTMGQTRSYGRVPLTRGPTLQDVLNITLSGCFQYLDDRRTHTRVIIPSIKLTNKLRMTGTDLTLSEYVCTRCRLYYDAFGVVISFRTLLQSLSVDEAYCEPPELFFRDLANLISRSPVEWVLRMHELETFKTCWSNRTSDLTLKQKVYLSRGDIRAYVVCRNKILHLAGSCLQTLLVPKAENVYRRTEYARSVKRVGKNVLDITLRVAESSFVRTVLLDISSFTSSNVNTNALPLAMLFALRKEKKLEWLNKPINFSVRGEHFTAHLDDILKHYIYHSALADLYIESWNETKYVAGGYLGVPANMALAMMVLLIAIKHVRREARSLSVNLCDQPGGDDVFFVLIGKVQSVDVVTNSLRQTISKYVGHLKEFVTVDIPVGFDSLIGEFCKKCVACTRSSNSLRIRSVVQLPILETMISHVRKKDHYDVMRSVYFDANVVLKRLPERLRRELVEIYLTAFELRHGRRRGGLLLRRTFIKDSENFKTLSRNVKVTEEALVESKRIQDVISLGQLLRHTDFEKLQYLCTLKGVSSKTIDSVSYFYLTKSEKTHIGNLAFRANRIFSEESIGLALKLNEIYELLNELI